MQRADQLWAVERMQLSSASRSLQPSGKRTVVTDRIGSRMSRFGTALFTAPAGKELGLSRVYCVERPENQCDQL